MLYHLFDHLQQIADVPGAGLFQYISFRAAAAAMLSLLVSILAGRRIIEWLQLKQVGEIVRDLGLEGQMQKQGTPTCLLYTSPSPRDRTRSRMPSSA